MALSKKLNQRLTFASRAAVDDGYGNVSGAFVVQFTVWGNIKFLRGSEAVQGARLEGRKPVIFTVRKSTDSDRITASWRVTVDGESYNIRENPSRSDNRLYCEFMAESGVAG